MDWLDALERLTRLHRDGALSDAEFAEQKARILDQSNQAESGSSALDAAEPRGSSLSAGWLLAGLVGAALLGVLLWWRLVDDRGMVKPVPVASASAAKPARTVAALEPVAAIPTVSPAAILAQRPVAALDDQPPARDFAPSFSCAGQSDTVLKLICGSRELSRKDRILSTRFKEVLAGLDKTDQQTLLRRQREFLRERATCEDIACIDDWYDRVNEFYL
jgi:uncharacterized protein YecT (DUF1311 family)